MESRNLGIFFVLATFLGMYDLRPCVRPSAIRRVIIDHRTFSFFTYTLTNPLDLGKLFLFFYVGPTTTLFSQTFESPAKTESEVRGRLRHCSRLGRALLGRTSLSPSGAVIPSLIQS